MTVAHQLRSAPTDGLDDRHRALRAAVALSLMGTDEHPEAAPLTATRGRVPERLRGVLYRNGPGRFAVGEDRLGHLFDGDGLVSRVSFDAGGATYRSRFVRTRAFVDESRAGRVLYRSYGTNRPGGALGSALRLRFKNAANTAVELHAGRLLALWEGGLPHALDPETLETLGPHDFDGALRPGSWATRALGGEAPFCAHPKTDPLEDERMLAFGVEPGLRSQLRVYSIDASGALEVEREIPMPAASFVHDFAVTEHYYVFLLSSVRVDIARMAGGVSTLLGSLETTDEGVRPLLVPRDRSRPVMEAAPLPRGFVYHLVNGFEAGGQIVLDALWLDAFHPGHFSLAPGSPLRRGMIPNACLRRVFICPRSGRALSQIRLHEAAELPAIDPRLEGRRARHAWMVMASSSRPDLFSAIGRVDLDTGRTTRRDLWPLVAAEPVFCPDPAADGELDGWLVLVCTDTTAPRSVLTILDARTMATVAELPLPQLLPPSFHGAWVAQGNAGRSCEQI